MLDLLLISYIKDISSFGSTYVVEHPASISLPIAGMYNLLKDEINVKIYNPHLLHSSIEIPEAKYYGISVYTTEFRASINLIKEIKNKYSDSIIFVGGFHAKSDPLSFIKYKEIDFVAYGDGLQVVEDLFINNKDIKDIDNIITQENKEINFKTTKKYNISYFLNKEAFYGIDWNYLETNKLDEISFIWVYSSTGCIYDCNFCTNKRLTQRKITIPNCNTVVDDINKLLTEYPYIKMINISDPNSSNPIPKYRTYLDELLSKLDNSKLIDNDVYLGLFTEMNKADDDFFNVLSKHKVKYMLQVGVDHFSNVVLEDMGKVQNNNTIFNFIDLIKKYNINTDYIVSNIIIGTPKESVDFIPESINMYKKIYKLCYDNGIHFDLSVTNLWLLPKTYYYENRFEHPDKYVTDIDWYEQTKSYKDQEFYEISVGLTNEWITYCNNIRRKLLTEFRDYRNSFY